MEDVLLHGDLDLYIIEARNLPNKDMFTEHLRRCFTACGLSLPFRSKPQSPNHHHHPEAHITKIITSDPYVSVLVAGATVARTQVISNEQNPQWNQHFYLPLAHHTPHLEFCVKDNDVCGAQLIGTASIPAGEVVTAGELIDKWLQILCPSGTPLKHAPSLHVKLRFTPVSINSIAGNPQRLGVQGTYFPVRKGGMVTLYQDAHVKETDLQEMQQEDGRVFRQGTCWEDMCHAILEAHRLIYVVGWSIYDKVRLVREPTRPLPAAGKLTLGELLKYKSEEGVRVCLLVWDDKTSHDKFPIKTEGVMQTHDEETRKFFKHSSVICVLSPRYPSNKLSIFKQQVVGTIFSHHQKCLLVDTHASTNMRKLTAFMGGLDLCKGRYDTPEHRLFTDLETTFLNDFHNPTIPPGTRGPRQPWHDLHCKIEGPAAYDVLKNFEQRWHMANKLWVFQNHKWKSHWKDDSLIKLERISWIVSPSVSVADDDPSLWVSGENDSESWDVQIFRSIDSGSVDFPKYAHCEENQHLVFRKNVAIDKSIHTAYVRAIRSAQHFIYIENQYFIGSSYGWADYKSPGADNLIPMELALKIASKIRAGEQFAVYVVIPMWPEGKADSGFIKEILYWQGQTMKMMYNIVGQELKLMKLENAHPLDYLNFYCLGKREKKPNQQPEAMNQPSEKNQAAPAPLFDEFQRFMIYVHAKGLIVDDEYVILGSANINQRSLDGSRDTEIAMGAYQPHHTWAQKQRHPRGQVYGYRMSLWFEHLGMLQPCFKDPQRLVCVQTVNKIAEDNWTRYIERQMIPLQGHLIKYPISVDASGNVGHLVGHECFPDIDVKILGEHITTLLDELTM